jgi:hypothetical protein
LICHFLVLDPHLKATWVQFIALSQ